MPIFRLSTELHISYPSHEIDGMQLTLQNCGVRQTDILVEIDSPSGLLVRELRNLKPQSEIASLFMIKNIATHRDPFILQIITNTRHEDSLLILVELLKRDMIVARHTNKDFTIWE